MARSPSGLPGARLRGADAGRRGWCRIGKDVLLVLVHLHVEVLPGVGADPCAARQVQAILPQIAARHSAQRGTHPQSTDAVDGARQEAHALYAVKLSSPSDGAELSDGEWGAPFGVAVSLPGSVSSPEPVSANARMSLTTSCSRSLVSRLKARKDEH